jgi:hypothetical protein
MRRLFVIFALFVACAVPNAAGAASWHSEQPVSATTGVAAPLGEIGDIEFWAPNRGALITGPVGRAPAGVYIYNGQSWHQYSTVCGGAEGKIAWAGPDEFWTVSDQPVGQESLAGLLPKHKLSLCHFQNGAVGASYAEPLDQATSYGQMNAAVCSAPDDCWFGGASSAAALNEGAFHLHWNGSTLTALPSLTVPEPELEASPRPVTDITEFQGNLYESVSIGNEESDPAEPDPTQPSRIHLIEPSSPRPFRRLFSEAPLSFGGGEPSALGPFRLAPSGQRLVAVAGAAIRGFDAAVTVVQVTPAGYTQVPLNDPHHVLEVGDTINSAAAEPGTDRVWVDFETFIGQGTGPGATRLVGITADGTVEEPVVFPSGEGPQHGIGGPIVCPAAEQCWLATEQGWLYHLGGPLPLDTDPLLIGPITYRPPDDSIPHIPPAELPIDDSGAEPAAPPREEPVVPELPAHRSKPRKLVAKVHQTVIHKTVLQLTFLLRGMAHVQLLAKDGKKVVAKTPRMTLAKGHHRLRLRLDPKQWPDNLDFEVHRAKAESK